MGREEITTEAELPTGMTAKALITGLIYFFRELAPIIAAKFAGA